MNAFATALRDERADYIEQFAAEAQLPPYIVEKDFWVCWLLGRIFTTKGLGENCVFKGGTSLSKVYGAIQRFSEDIDLALTPASLGWSEAELDDAPSKSQRRKRMEMIGEACAVAVESQYRPVLEQSVAGSLGERPRGTWLSCEMHGASHSPVLYFDYPQAVLPGTYVTPQVKIEFGSLTDQRPTGTYGISALVAEITGDDFDDLHADVVALEIDRTFWEKATILHAEYHRPAEQKFRDRFARHYSDFAALWRHAKGRQAAQRMDLLNRVRIHKSRYFASSWAHYDSALPGTLRLSPPAARLDEIRRDYAAMEMMFMKPPLPFEELLAILREAENTLNG